MNRTKSFSKLKLGLLAAALASSLPVAVHARDFVSTDFQDQTRQAQAAPQPAMDYSGYEKVNFLVGDTILVPKNRGVQGPIRTETLDPSSEAAAMASENLNRDIQRRLWPIGGPNTF